MRRSTAVRVLGSTHAMPQINEPGRYVRYRTVRAVGLLYYRVMHEGDPARAAAKENGRMGTLLMVFAGEYDLTCKEQLRDSLDQLCAAPKVIMNFSDVTYIDSTAITELIRMHNARAAKSFSPATLVLRNESAARILKICQMDSLFRCVDTLDEAIGKDGEAVTIRYAFTNGETVEPLDPVV